MTFEEKLEKFKSERVGFRVSSEEIAKELAKVFERKHMKPRGGSGIKKFIKDATEENMEYPGIPYVTYNYIEGEHKLSYGTDDFTDEDPIDLLDVTPEELRAYNG